jgi:hypothetical protein
MCTFVSPIFFWRFWGLCLFLYCCGNLCCHGSDQDACPPCIVTPCISLHMYCLPEHRTVSIHPEDRGSLSPNRQRGVTTHKTAIAFVVVFLSSFLCRLPHLLYFILLCLPPCYECSSVLVQSDTVGAGSSVGIATELRAGRFGNRIPVVARFSVPAQTGPGAHSASCTMGTGVFPGVESGRDVTLAPHPLLMPRSKNRVELYLYSP